MIRATFRPQRVAPFVLTMVLFAAVGGYLLHISHAATAAIIVKPMTFSDDFNNAQLSGWTKTDETTAGGSAASWVPFQGVTSGVVRVLGNVGAGSTSRDTIEKPGTYLTAGNAGWKDYSYSVRLKATDSAGAGVMFHYTNNNNYYRFSMDRQLGYRRLIKKVNGQYSTLWQDTGFTGNASATNSSSDAFKLSQWYRLDVQIVGGAIAINLIDESTGGAVMHVAAQDVSLPSGSVGLYSWSMDNVYYDDVKVTATVAGGFTLAILPDTQGYSQSDTPARPLFDSQTRWIAENRGPQKIAFVLHEGDIVDDICDNAQWSRASASMNLLDGKVPYSFAPGNHDILAYDSCVGKTIDTAVDGSVYGARSVYTNKLNQYFPASRYQAAATFGGTLKPGDMSNVYSLFSAGGLDFVVISLQFGPTDSALTWAKSVAAQYPARHVMLLTHDYLSEKGTLRGTNPDGTPCPRQPIDYPSTIVPTPTVIRCTPTNQSNPQTPSVDWALPSVAGMNTGYEMYSKLVSPQSNIDFVLNGHVASSYAGASVNYATEGDIGYLATPRPNTTKKIYQLLANFQSIANGGNGYMRLLKFTPDAAPATTWSVTVSTYSPRLNTYLVNGSNNAARTDDGKNQFTITGVQL